ncbi:hypothetical protein [Nitrospirillum sp. BR 11828]|uniref:hypothetical protein n=1 Tax=Nitrospirillum sp. BR 11828 TaxID=3104325 RepID=UPI002ACAECF0|nr:hypothetical protein [Nitrospirillum sp. BR 11828]MDZ5648128.1 hypothetical protein [Nitrospirillum sp. BR 11828]
MAIFLTFTAAHADIATDTAAAQAEWKAHEVAETPSVVIILGDHKFTVPSAYFSSGSELAGRPKARVTPSQLQDRGLEIAFWLPDGRPTERWLTSDPWAHQAEAAHPDPGDDDWIVQASLTLRPLDVDISNEAMLTRVIGILSEGEFSRGADGRQMDFRQSRRRGPGAPWHAHYRRTDQYSMLVECILDDAPNPSCTGRLELVDFGLYGRLRIPPKALPQLDQLMLLLIRLLNDWKG